MADGARCRRGAAAALALALALAGCATGVERHIDPDLPPPTVAAQWQAPLPHGGDPVALARWWQQFDDPALVDLLDAAGRVSPTIASAQSRIEQARAARAAAGATLLPGVNATAGLTRGRRDLSMPMGTLVDAGVQASWELDVFGANRNARDAAQARLEGARAGWHDARVAVAAELANVYVGLRACEAQLAQSTLDAASRAETARLTGLSTEAGFESPANAALARASAAQASGAVTQQRQRCDLDLKALVALTGLAEPALRARLAPGAARIPVPASIGVPGVPAAALAQRPDVHSAALNVLAAASDLTRAEKARLPRISLAGTIGISRFSGGSTTVTGSTWTIGPVQVSLPLFEGGRIRAEAAAAAARLDEASIAYLATLRGAIREVESALVTLEASRLRQADVATAVEGFDASWRAAEARYRSGFGSLFELEDARRTALAAAATVIELDRERTAAWIALYRALGGGWSAPDSALADAATTPAPRAP